MCYTVGLCCLSILYIAKPFIHIHLFNLHNNLMSRLCCYACFLCSPMPVPSCCTSHDVCCILSTYLPFNWKFGPFDCLYSISPSLHQLLVTTDLRTSTEKKWTYDMKILKPEEREAVVNIKFYQQCDTLILPIRLARNRRDYST